VNVEIVVSGALGDLAIRALGDIAVERRQVLVMPAPVALDALDRLTAQGVEVLAVRERLVSDENARYMDVLSDAAISRGGGLQDGPLPRQCPRSSDSVRAQESVEIFEPLTAKEREVLGHLSELLTTGEIAATMYISVNTVRTHVRNILRKLAATRRNEAVRRARSLKLVPM
jgi:DNA-binding CsgD family transcriptional regulator